ncbi:hypothetical protein CRE_08443 [Caenorhabditis remanei]|uniref:Zinc metalloproteinase n=1 Tax=Caenorhabditis remanei TaxID=31234 RepID=E3N015_CAERE|nr:hypothetical protein CRE_08443 [Caenorhabditis remanei]
MYSLWFLFFILSGFLLPQRVFSINYNSNNDTERFLNERQILNELQAEIFGISLPPTNDENPYLFEGDVLLTEQQLDIIIDDVRAQLWAIKHPEDTMEKPKNRILTSDLSTRWTLPIPYYIDSGVNESIILPAIRHWEQETCIRFSRKNSKPSGNYLNFFQGSGCWSFIGMIGGEQNVSIGVGCHEFGFVAHEIAHALGAYHEHSRYNRDSYITLMPSNMVSGSSFQFIKLPSSNMTDYGVGYDYGSVMHYGSHDYSFNGLPTIITAEPMYENIIGQRVAPSFADVKKMNSAYCNAVCTKTLACSNGGYLDPNNCNTCKCPPGFSGKLCRAHPVSGPCGNQDLTASSTFASFNVSGRKTCYFLITAPLNQKVQIQHYTSVFHPIDVDTCKFDYIEIKYKTDFTKYGPRFCKGSVLPVTTSETNKMMIVYQGYDSNSFVRLRYRSI